MKRLPSTTDARNRNRLLHLLTASEYARLAPSLELVELKPGQDLIRRGQIEFVYFPISGIVTKVVLMIDGNKVDAGMIGNEGMVPLCLFLGVAATPFEAVVQNSGQALRMTAEAFVASVRSVRRLYPVILRFAAAFMAQVSLSAACKQLHTLRSQYCCFLLMSVDRLDSQTICLTQAAAADFLGVRRMSISEIANQLQHDGVIQYRRGTITVVDRARLSKNSCECYARIREVYEGLSLI